MSEGLVVIGNMVTLKDGRIREYLDLASGQDRLEWFDSMTSFLLESDLLLTAAVMATAVYEDRMIFGFDNS